MPASSSTPTSIADVPNELVCEIFELVSCSPDSRPIPPRIKTDASLPIAEIDEPDDIRDKGGRLGWIGVCHVSSRWRRIGLNLSRLWAKDIGRLPRALLPMLERAGDHLLDVYVNVSQTRDGGDLILAYLLLSNVAPWVRAITYVDPRMDQDLPFDGRRFPHLTSLEAFGYWHQEDMALSKIGIHAPELLYAQFLNCAIPLRSCPRFTTLIIRQECTGGLAGEYPDWIFGLTELNTVLAPLAPTLECLGLDLVLFDDRVRDETLPRIFLSKLKDLFYHNKSEQRLALLLLTLITYPPSASVTAYMDLHQEDSLWERDINWIERFSRAGTRIPYNCRLDLHESGADIQQIIIVFPFSFLLHVDCQRHPEDSRFGAAYPWALKGLIRDLLGLGVMWLTVCGAVSSQTMQMFESGGYAVRDRADGRVDLGRRDLDSLPHVSTA